eukprot:gene11078-11234_t
MQPRYVNIMQLRAPKLPGFTQQRTYGQRRPLQRVSLATHGTPDGGILPLGGGDAIYISPARPDLGPSFEYSMKQAVEVQLQALKENDKPKFDHGIEVMYRFANFDPFQRSKYFGKSFDLVGIKLVTHCMLLFGWWRLPSQLSESVWKMRVLVIGPYGKEQGVYEFTMIQRLGGRYDGYWFTETLIADDNDWSGGGVLLDDNCSTGDLWKRQTSRTEIVGVSGGTFGKTVARASGQFLAIDLFTG